MQAKMLLFGISGEFMTETKLQWKLNSSIGPLYLVASQHGLQGVYWNKQTIKMAKDPSESKFLKQAVKEILQYLSGERKSFSVALDIQGTEFQKKVWNELRQIPYGKTISYKELAQNVKNEKACRAVGTANGRNPLSLIIPCHRVIAANGTLGGYAGGLDIKTTLLSLEK